jgi:hypothetical protein
MRLEALVRAFLIDTHQARIAHYIGGKDRGEAADRGHVSRGGRFGLTNSTPKPAAALAFSGPGRPKCGA